MWIYGINPVRELLRKRPEQVKKIIYASSRTPGPALRQVLELAEKAGIHLSSQGRQELSRICGSDAHQGILAQAPPPAYQDLKQVLGAPRKNPPGLFVILDGLMDPQNLGSCIRVAEEASADAVIVPQHRSCGLTPAVAKASAGAWEWLPICQVTNLNQALNILKKEGFWVAAADQDGETDYCAMDYRMPLALIIGSEGRGIRQLLKKNADFVLRIPLWGRVGSLNASVALAVILFEAARQRRAPREATTH